jgi:hypothetical protein
MGIAVRKWGPLPCDIIVNRDAELVCLNIIGKFAKNFSETWMHAKYQDVMHDAKDRIDWEAVIGKQSQLIDVVMQTSMFEIVPWRNIASRMNSVRSLLGAVKRTA